MRSTTTKTFSLSAMIWALAAAGAFSMCAPDKADLRGDWGTARFTVEIADDPSERARGLMFRESMPTLSGMLFIYERPQKLSFWMRNTLISLDLLFLDETGTVVTIQENAIPLDETPLSGGEDPLLAVLEINGGLAKKLGIAPGTQLRHPQLPQAVAQWPCTEN